MQYVKDITLHTYRLNLKESTSSLFQHNKKHRAICIIKHCHNQMSQRNQLSSKMGLSGLFQADFL